MDDDDDVERGRTDRLTMAAHPRPPDNVLIFATPPWLVREGAPLFLRRYLGLFPAAAAAPMGDATAATVKLDLQGPRVNT